MATYTTELRTLIEQSTQYRDDLTLDQRIEVGRAMLFDFDYPLFDGRYKRTFETNFIRHFYHREIGFETEYLFKQRLRNWLNLNMGYFNQLFESELIEFDPLINSKMDITHTLEGNRDNTGSTTFGETSSRDITETTDTDETTDTTGQSTRDTTGDVSTTASGEVDTTESTTGNENTTSDRDTDTFNRQLHTDTPDTRLAITTNDGSGTVGYASDITENKEVVDEGVVTNTTRDDERDQKVTTSDTSQSDTTQNEQTVSSENEQRDELVERVLKELGKRDYDQSVTGNIKNLEDYVEHRIGKIGIQSYSSMLRQFRETFLRIEVDIFKEMESKLFMLVY